MAVNTTVQVAMPAMGESVTEGTVLEWHKREGDSVEADETLVEISTDKVDAEVPSPASGTIVKVHAAERETVEGGQLLAEISTNGRQPTRPDDGPHPTPPVQPRPPARQRSPGQREARRIPSRRPSPISSTSSP